MGGLWGSGTALELYLKEEGINTLFFAGVNTDQVRSCGIFCTCNSYDNTFPQCVLGTLIDAYFAGYDNILIQDAAATTSPDAGQFAVTYNTEAVRHSVSDICVPF